MHFVDNLLLRLKAQVIKRLPGQRVFCYLGLVKVAEVSN